MPSRCCTPLSCRVYCSAMQTALMVAGAAVLSVFSLQAVGGYSGLVDGYSQAQAHYIALGRKF